MANDVRNIGNVIPYVGSYGIFVGNGNVLPISHTGSISFLINKIDFDLDNFLHASSLSANLISVQNLFLDNNVCIEFYTHCFCIKATMR